MTDPAEAEWLRTVARTAAVPVCSRCRRQAVHVRRHASFACWHCDRWLDPTGPVCERPGRPSLLQQRR